MAIGTLTPTFRVCFNNSCSTIDVYDTTGAYNAVSNTGGWGATNIDTADVDSVIIDYTSPGATSSTSVDVTATVNAEVTVTGEFLLDSIDISATDGEYLFTYTADEGGTSVTKTLTIFSTCVARCCIDKLWSKAAIELIDGDCGCSDNSSVSYTKTALKAEALYQAIRNAAASNRPSTRDALLVKLQRICNLENCNCN